MSIFDLLFLALVAVSVAVLTAAGARAVRGDRRRAAGLLWRYAIAFAAYMTVVALTSLVLPRRVVNVGEPMCSDDWCIAVANAGRSTVGDHAIYRVAFRISSRARRVTQRERGVSVYLVDGAGHRYPVRPVPADVPFDVAIRPQEAFETERLFDVPAAVRDAGLIIRHDSGFPIGWFIIGYDTWFRKPAVVRLEG